MTNLDIVIQRLHNQHLSRPTFEKPEEVVRWLGAVQAQDFLYSLWAVGLRMTHATEADIEQAIADRTIVRTWPMRGTVHFVPAEDAAWMLTLLSQRVINSYQSVRRRAGLDEKILAKSRHVLTKALQGKQLTRKEVYAALEEAGIAANHSTPIGTRGLHIIGYLALEGLLCFGPRRGKQPTFVLLDEWVPNPRKLEGDEALAELASRYFRSHGPATEYDFAWWAGLTVSDARLAVELVKPQLESETMNDQTYWFTHSMPAIQEPSGDAYLLPFLDEYTVAYKDRSALVDPRYLAEINASSQFGMLGPVIVIGGRVVGAWKRTLKKDKVIIETIPVTPLSVTEEKAISAAAQRYGAFLDMTIVLK
jgi:hypothetical protein